jgi:anhydro-N-acetylmuramic acid kinase
VKIAGLLSGTSLDAIDVAVCDVRVADGRVEATCERFAAIPFADDVRQRILAAFPPAPVGALELSALHAAIGEAFGDALAAVASGIALDAVASHGITLAHDGDAHHSLQLGDAFRIRERAGVTVVYDFRSADTAAGGHGAPLVPFVDAVLFADRGPCVAVNLGGIANLTVLPAGIAFDAGPANLPIDAYVQLRSKGAHRCDRDGALARGGTASAALLAEMLADPYFDRPPPKTTGRERFGLPFVSHWSARLDRLSFADAVATLTALAAQSCAGAVRDYASDAALVIVSGGGARNPALVDALRAALPERRVAISDEFGIDADAKEALAFAVLGAMTLLERAAGLPRVTGANGARVLGAIAPQGLATLLERLRREARGGAPVEPEKHGG